MVISMDGIKRELDNSLISYDGWLELPCPEVLLSWIQFAEVYATMGEGGCCLHSLLVRQSRASRWSLCDDTRCWPRLTFLEMTQLGFAYVPTLYVYQDIQYGPSRSYVALIYNCCCTFQCNTWFLIHFFISICI